MTGGKRKVGSWFLYFMCAFFSAFCFFPCVFLAKIWGELNLGLPDAIAEFNGQQLLRRGGVEAKGLRGGRDRMSGVIHESFSGELFHVIKTELLALTGIYPAIYRWTQLLPLKTPTSTTYSDTILYIIIHEECGFSRQNERDHAVDLDCLF